MRITTIVFILAAGSQLGATDCGNALKDTGFDLWCGDQLCAWKVERGDVARVPTWNEGDPGVELVGSDVAIEQLSPVDSGDGNCLEFKMIANVDETADVELDIDVFGDGSVEYHERIPTAHWRPLTYQIAITPPYAGIRFEVAKTGSGRAQLANIGARVIVDGCQGLTPILPAPAPLGSPCDDDLGCQSSLCSVGELPQSFHAPGVCVACDSATPCPSGMTCGAGAPTSPVRAVPTQCVPTASKVLGEQCGANAECATGICEGNTCSTCGKNMPCTGGETCGPDWRTPLFGAFSPWVCSPNGHRRAHGEPCGSDDDCQSSSCGGAPRTQCEDGRACVTDAECPFLGGLTNTACLLAGVQGGSCR